MAEHEQVREEQSELGEATGVELEKQQLEAVDHIDQPFDPDRIDVTTRNPTVDLLLSRIRSGTIDLEPDFQRRRGIWTDQRQSRLIESMLLRIPLPTLYAAEDADERWAIVDGIQRLTAILRFIEPEAMNTKPLHLSGLEYLGKQYSNAGFHDLPGRLQTRLRETELVLHLIRQGTPEEVKYNIFARINTGGMPLSAQELRHALIAGPIRARLKALAESTEFVSATSGSIRDERMADREMVLRFIAFYLQPAKEYTSQDFDDFLRKAMHESNALSATAWQTVEGDFRASMNAAKAIFGVFAFRKLYSLGGDRYPINKALFDTISGNLAKLTDVERQRLVKNREGVMTAFVELMSNHDFDSSISQGTGDVAKVRLRFSEVQKLFAGVLS
jgi:hypothetical protein